MHPELLENELIFEYDDSISKNWFEPLINQISLSLIEHDIERNIATHLGASTGRITFELTKMFEEVIYLIKKENENFITISLKRLKKGSRN